MRRPANIQRRLSTPRPKRFDPSLISHSSVDTHAVRPPRRHNGLLVGFVVVSSVAALSCTIRSRRPDGPYREAQELADALSDQAVDCMREHSSEGTGEVIIAADVSHAGAPLDVQDAGSSAGTDAVIACIRQHATEKLRSPRTAPAAFLRIRLPLPLVTSEIKYAFVKELPASEPVSNSP